MQIFKTNTEAVIEIVPRVTLSGAYFFYTKSESTDTSELISCTFAKLDNENYSIILSTFPQGNVNERFYLELRDASNNIVYIDKFMIVDELENIQDLEINDSDKFY